MLKRVQLPIEEINIVLLDENIVEEAEQWVLGCEHCTDVAILELDYVLDAITGCDPQVTEYVMCRPAQCPFCSSEVQEKTRVAV
jgi:hypothetical protein